jgi:tRNA/rRNA methyltransferase
MAPVIILVRPQLVENIGTAARAMMNCELNELRIVNPRDPWPLQSPQKERMASASAGADALLESAKIYAALPQALEGLHTIYATSARTRDMTKEVSNPRAAMDEIRARMARGEKIGLLFGPERTGLTNEDLTLVEKCIAIPANPEFSSLNLAQAVMVLAYEWYAGDRNDLAEVIYGNGRPAHKEELLRFFEHLERELEAGGFFSTPEMRPVMVQNIRNAILRAELSEQEVRTWHGMIAALTEGQRRRKAS